MSESSQTYGQYMAAYKKRTCKRYTFDVNREKYSDVIEHLESLGRGKVNGYLINLIREDMAKSR